MHLRGKACRYELTANGELLDVPRCDFNWQLLYRYAEPPIRRIRIPTRPVRWGPQTFEEMLLGYVEYVVPAAKPGDVQTLPRGMAGAGARLNGLLFRSADADGDGKVTLDEFKRAMARVPALADRPGLAERLFTRLDADGGGTLSPEEFDKIRELGRQ